jgi:hypothetical protein
LEYHDSTVGIELASSEIAYNALPRDTSILRLGLTAWSKGLIVKVAPSRQLKNGVEAYDLWLLEHPRA